MRFHHSKNPSRIALGVLTVGALVVLSSCASSTPEPEESAAGVDFPVATGSGSPTVLDDAEWESLVEAANAEGELIVYSSPPGTEETFAQFSEDYPDITVTVVREPTSDLIARMDQEIDAGVAGADVTWHSQPAWAATRAEDGALNALQLSPEAAELGWGEFATDDYYLQIMANPYLLGWNTTLGEPVDNIQDLLAKAGDTPVGIAEPISQNGMFQLQTWMDEYGEDFLGELAALNHTVIRSTTPLAQSLAAGEVGYAILMQPGPARSAEGGGRSRRADRAGRRTRHRIRLRADDARRRRPPRSRTGVRELVDVAADAAAPRRQPRPARRADHPRRNRERAGVG